MNYSKVTLTQIEPNDLPTVKHITNGLLPYLLTPVEFNQSSVNHQYKIYLEDINAYYFSIRGLKDGFKLITLGFCALRNINWVSRHSEVYFIMLGGKCTVPHNSNAKDALGQLLRFAFEEVNLNKVYINVIDGNEIREILGDFGFVAEGSQRESVFKKGRFLDVTVYSLLAQEYREK